jgi:hypothetical protein
MLVALGARALTRALTRRRGQSTPRALEAHAQQPGFLLAPQPLIVGCVHGLAGSGALAALMVAQMRSFAAGLVYMAVYGAGAALGMAMLAGLAGVPLARLVRTRRGVSVLLAATGCLSLVLGVGWGWAAWRPALAP